MTSVHPPCRTYIVYQDGLFAQGVRSLLEKQGTVRILGMESDVAKALKVIRSLKPEVIIIEEPTGKGQRVCVGMLLDRATAGRVVTLSLDHHFATVYNKNRMATLDPADLVKAIHGDEKRQHLVGPDRPQAGAVSKPGSQVHNTRSKRRERK